VEHLRSPQPQETFAVARRDSFILAGVFALAAVVFLTTRLGAGRDAVKRWGKLVDRGVL